MNALSRRLRKLEGRFTPQPTEEERQKLALLQARHRRIMEARGESYNPEPTPILANNERDRLQQFVDILRGRHAERRRPAPSLLRAKP